MKVAFEDIINTKYVVSAQIYSWTTSFAEIQSKINNFCNATSSFDGEAAQSARDYMKEVYSYVFVQLNTLLCDYETKFDLYISKLLEIENSVVSILDTDTLEAYSKELSFLDTYIVKEDGLVQAALGDIDDLYEVTLTSCTDIETEMQELSEDLKEFVEKIEDAERDGKILYKYYSSYFDALLKYIANHKDSKISTISSYQLGDVYQDVKTQDLNKQFNNSINFSMLNNNSISDSVKTVYGAIDELDKVNKLRNKEKAGLYHLFRGANSISGAVIAMLEADAISGGTITPFVIFVFIASLAGIAFGASEMVEGNTDFYDLITNNPNGGSENPLRDFLFQNEPDPVKRQEYYEVFYNLVSCLNGSVTDVKEMLNKIGSNSFSDALMFSAYSVSTQCTKDEFADIAINMLDPEGKLDDAEREVLKNILTSVDDADKIIDTPDTITNTTDD